MVLLRLLRRHERVIISHRNAGFGDNLLSAANAWYYAKNTGRALVIWWQPSMYIADQTRNAFGQFFRVPENIEGVPVIAEPRPDPVSSFLVQHPYFFTPRPEPLTILYKILSKLPANTGELFKQRRKRRLDEANEIIDRLADIRQKVLVLHSCKGPRKELKSFYDSLRLSDGIQDKADEFAGRHFRNKKVIGVHIRYYNANMMHSDHTPYWLDHTGALIDCLNKIKKTAAGLNGSEYVVFLCTDSRMVYEFISRSVDNVVAYEKEFGRDTTKELHYQLPVRTAEASLIEMFLLARSDILVRYPPGSWFSHYASLYVKEIVY